MTNSIQQITSSMIKNESQCCSCGIIEIIPPWHFIRIRTTNVHTLAQPIRCLRNAAATQTETCTRGKYPEGGCFPHLTRMVLQLQKGKATATQDILLAALWRYPWGATANIGAGRCCSRCSSVLITSCVSVRKMTNDSHRLFPSVTQQRPPKEYRIMQCGTQGSVKSLSSLSLKITFQPLLVFLSGCKCHS